MIGCAPVQKNQSQPEAESVTECAAATEKAYGFEVEAIIVGEHNIDVRTGQLSHVHVGTTIVDAVERNRTKHTCRKLHSNSYFNESNHGT